LYAPEGVCNCPPFVMATLAELAEHGIVGSADALPMPVREEPQGERLSIARIAEIQQRVDAATPGPWEEHAAYGENFYAYLGGPYLRGVGTLNFGDGDDAEADKALTVNAREDIRALLSELFTVRAELRVARGRVAELEAKAATARTEAIADVGDWLDEHGEKNAAHLVYTCDIPAARDMVTHVVADDSDDPEHVDDCPGCKTQQTGGAE